MLIVSKLLCITFLELLGTFEVEFSTWFRRWFQILVSIFKGKQIGFDCRWFRYWFRRQQRQDLRTLKFGAIRVAASADQCVHSVFIYDQLSEGLAADKKSAMAKPARAATSQVRL